MNFELVILIKKLYLDKKNLTVEYKRMLSVESSGIGHSYTDKVLAYRCLQSREYISYYL